MIYASQTRFTGKRTNHGRHSYAISCRDTRKAQAIGKFFWKQRLQSHSMDRGPLVKHFGAPSALARGTGLAGGQQSRTLAHHCRPQLAAQGQENLSQPGRLRERALLSALSAPI